MVYFSMLGEEHEHKPCENQMGDKILKKNVAKKQNGTDTYLSIENQ